MNNSKEEIIEELIEVFNTSPVVKAGSDSIRLYNRKNYFQHYKRVLAMLYQGDLQEGLEAKGFVAQQHEGRHNGGWHIIKVDDIAAYKQKIISQKSEAEKREMLSQIKRLDRAVMLKQEYLDERKAKGSWEYHGDYYVYHISDDFTDTTKGYIGVSFRPDTRWDEHSVAETNVGSKIRELKLNPEDNLRILLATSETEAYKIEKAFRPHPYIGWNVADGGVNNAFQEIAELKKVRNDYYTQHEIELTHMDYKKEQPKGNR